MCGTRPGKPCLPASPGTTREMTWGRGEGAVCADSNAVCQCQGRRRKEGSRMGQGWGGAGQMLTAGSVLLFWGDRPYPPEPMGFTC